MSGDVELARDLLARGLAELAEDAPEPVLDALVGLCERVARWTQRVDLTGHRSASEVAQGLVLDALALGAAAPPFRSLVDLGSGAGFPGLPLAILRPGLSVTLVEARERRHHFQRAVIRELGVPNAHALLGRAESLSPRPSEAVVAQAVATPDRVLALMRPWALPGGVLLVPGAERAPEVPEGPEVSESEVVSYTVPVSGRARTLWVGKLRAD